MTQENHLPFCCVCHRKVDRITRVPHWSNPLLMRFIVECHGKIQEQMISMSDIRPGDTIRPGLAFLGQAFARAGWRSERDEARQ